MAFKFRKHQRILKNREFRTVYGSRQRGGSALFTYHVQPSPDTSTSRLGVTVSKKVSKAAVHRNKIKRQVREFFRLHHAELDSAVLVVTAKRDCAQASDAERWKDLELLWTKILGWRAWHQRQQSKMVEPEENKT